MNYFTHSTIMGVAYEGLRGLPRFLVAPLKKKINNITLVESHMIG